MLDFWNLSLEIFIGFILGFSDDELIERDIFGIEFVDVLKMLENICFIIIIILRDMLIKWIFRKEDFFILVLVDIIVWVY